MHAYTTRPIGFGFGSPALRSPNMKPPAGPAAIKLTAIWRESLFNVISLMWPNDPSSATRRTGHNDDHGDMVAVRQHPAGFAAAQGF